MAEAKMTTMTKCDNDGGGDGGGGMQAPFPYFGGKSSVAAEVWRRLGSAGVVNYVEPFFGSGAVLLARPRPFPGVETVNDSDGLLCNFWRALAADPDAVARHADWPVQESDLHARHAWLVGQKDSLQARLEGDPEFYDARVAGWWCWGACCWIGSGWCSGEGPWQVAEVDGVRQLVHLGDQGRGVNRKLVHLGDQGAGVLPESAGLRDWFRVLACRLRHVRVCCGDWSRVLGPSVTVKHGLTAIFLDPPYGDAAGRDMTLYRHDSGSVAAQVRAWCLEHGGDRLLRVALCGYAGEGHEELERHGWRVHAWKARGGFGGQGRGEGGSRGRDNAARERIWFSPHCVVDRGLFDGDGADDSAD